MGRLQGKVAIITGAASGLGAEMARAFGREGATVILTDVNADGGTRVAAEIGASASFRRQDVRSEEEWEKLIHDVVGTYGRLDTLVNNAGIAHIDTPETVLADNYRRVMAVCADSVVFGCKYAIGAMRKSGGGSIINISSTASIQGIPHIAAYSAAKGAVESYSRSVAVYCSQLGLNIRCNSIHPATIATAIPNSDGIEIDLGELPPQANSYNRLGEASDVAYLAIYLASDESKFMSGQSLVLDDSASATVGHVLHGRRMTWS